MTYVASMELYISVVIKINRSLNFSLDLVNPKADVAKEQGRQNVLRTYSVNNRTLTHTPVKTNHAFLVSFHSFRRSINRLASRPVST